MMRNMARLGSIDLAGVAFFLAFPLVIFALSWGTSKEAESKAKVQIELEHTKQLQLQLEIEKAKH